MTQAAARVHRYAVEAAGTQNQQHPRQGNRLLVAEGSRQFDRVRRLGYLELEGQQSRQQCHARRIVDFPECYIAQMSHGIRQIVLPGTQIPVEVGKRRRLVLASRGVAGQQRQRASIARIVVAERNGLEAGRGFVAQVNGSGLLRLFDGIKGPDSIVSRKSKTRRAN